MRKFTITNADNTRMNVDLVRYFKFKNDCYLIYTLNEIDEKGYLKLYLVKIMEELGFPVTHSIKDDKEWSGMKAIIKKVIKEIKNNKRKLLEDLNYDNIQGIKIVEPRFFKLDQKLADILSSNYNVSINSDSNEPAFVTESSNLNLDVPNNINIVNTDNNSIIESVQMVNNASPVTLEVEETPSNLESIDETLLKQGAFDPINPLSSADLDNEKVSNNATLKGIDVADNPINENSETLENNIEVKNEQVVKSIPKDASDERSVINQIENNNIDNNDNISEKEIKQEDDKSIDYKALYISEREEKESINNAMNNLIEQLIKYKEKYGELE